MFSIFRMLSMASQRPKVQFQQQNKGEQISFDSTSEKLKHLDHASFLHSSEGNCTVPYATPAYLVYYVVLAQCLNALYKKSD